MQNVDTRKQLIKAYLFIFVLVLIMLNWGSIAWLFSYQAISGLTHDFFNPYPDSEFLVSASEIRLPPRPTPVPAPAPQMMSQQQIVAVQQPIINPVTAPISQIAYPPSTKGNSIEIPGIGIVSDMVIAKSADQKSLTKDLDKGVVFYPGSVLPGESGQMIVLGHSAPPNWPKIKHDWVFSKINDLNAGDKIIMYFNGKQYTYIVKKKSIIQKGSEITYEGGEKNILTIVSCWPPGKDYQRIAVQAELLVI